METGVPVEIVDVITKGRPETAVGWRRADVGKQGTIVDWIGVKGYKVPIPKIELLDGTICYGYEVAWKRLGLE